MTVRPIAAGRSELSIYFQGPGALNQLEIEQYKLFRGALLKKAKTVHKYMEQFGEPVNLAFWDKKMTIRSEIRLDPPHGISDLDARSMLALIFAQTPATQPVRIAVLGVTEQLLDACEKEARIGEYVCIDQTHVVVDGPSARSALEWNA